MNKNWNIGLKNNDISLKSLIFPRTPTLLKLLFFNARLLKNGLKKSYKKTPLNIEKMQTISYCLLLYKYTR